MPGMYVYKIYEDGNYAYAGDKNTEIYQLYLVDTGNEIQLSYNYRGSGPWEENILYTFSYTDGYNIDYYTSDDNENWNISKNEVDINYINNNVFDQPLSTNIKLDFHDIIDDPGDDPDDDPSDEDTYYIAFFTEGSYNNFYDTNNRGFYLAPGEDNQIQVWKMDGEGTNSVYTLDYTDGYRIDYYFSNDFDTADPPASSWQFVTSYTDYNDVNSGAMASLGSGNIKLDFYDIVSPTRPDKTKIGGSSIRLKKIGNATVVKEVLNGVVIYTAE